MESFLENNLYSKCEADMGTHFRMFELTKKKYKHVRPGRHIRRDKQPIICQTFPKPCQTFPKPCQTSPNQCLPCCGLSNNNCVNNHCSDPTAPGCPRSFIGRTIISVRNPNVVLVIPPEPLAPRFGGSRLDMLARPCLGPDVSVDLVDWTKNFDTLIANFNNVTGIYTAVEPGFYNIKCAISYHLERIVPIPEDIEETPILELYDVVTGARFKELAAQVPYISLNYEIPNPDSSLPPFEMNTGSLVNNGQLVIDTVVALKFGDRLRFRVRSNCVTSGDSSPTTMFLSPTNTDSTLTIYKINDRNNNTLTPDLFTF
jgi:hypothetical protein